MWQGVRSGKEQFVGTVAKEFSLNLSLAGETTVIVGGAKGIGRAIATAFADESANVALLDIDPAVEATARELSQGRKIKQFGHVMDATLFDNVMESVECVVNEFGGINHLVYAAGAGSNKYGFPFWNLDPADWPRVIEVNLLGAVNVAHAAAPHLVNSQHGTMLFISSVAAQIGSQTDPPYSASKAALINFSQCAAKDLAPHNVRVNTICPGMVKTALNHSVWQAWNDRQTDDEKIPYDEWADDKIKKLTPLARWQEPEDIASLAVFLASEKAKNITGQTMNVDGGWVMHW